jgi:hypothetical protein
MVPGSGGLSKKTGTVTCVSGQRRDPHLPGCISGHSFSANVIR